MVKFKSWSHHISWTHSSAQGEEGASDQDQHHGQRRSDWIHLDRRKKHERRMTLHDDCQSTLEFCNSIATCTVSEEDRDVEGVYKTAKMIVTLNINIKTIKNRQSHTAW